MKLYLIRHKPTGFYLPRTTGSATRRSPDPDPNKARIYYSRQQAKQSLIYWLEGVTAYIQDYWSGEIDLSTVHKPDRIASEYEIIEKELSLK